MAHKQFQAEQIIDLRGAIDLKPRAREVVMRAQRDFAVGRERIANEVKSIAGETRPAIIGTVALKYRVCNGTVRTECKEFNVTIPKIPHSLESTGPAVVES